MEVAQLGRLSLQGRTQLDRITVAQLNPADAPVPVKESIRGAEVLQGKVPVAGTLALENRVNPAQARVRQGQLAGGVPAEAIALGLEVELLELLLLHPELKTGLVLQQRRQGAADRLRTRPPGSAEGCPGGSCPRLTNGRRGKAIQARGGAQAGVAVRP